MTSVEVKKFKIGFVGNDTDFYNELNKEFNINEQQISQLDEFLIRGYDEGGFKIWDISDLTKPRLLNFVNGIFI